MLTVLHLQVCNTVQDSNSRKKALIGSASVRVSLLTALCHMARMQSLLPTLLFADIPREGRFVVNWEATTLVGIYHSACLPPFPKLISNKQGREKLYPRLSKAITLSSGKKLQDQREKNHQPVIFWNLRCYLHLHAYLAF